MTTIKTKNSTIKNFGNNKVAMIKYYNSIKNKKYVEMTTASFNTTQKAWCVEIFYTK